MMIKHAQYVTVLYTVMSKESSLSINKDANLERNKKKQKKSHHLTTQIY